MIITLLIVWSIFEEDYYFRDDVHTTKTWRLPLPIQESPVYVLNSCYTSFTPYYKLLLVNRLYREVWSNGGAGRAPQVLADSLCCRVLPREADSASGP